MLKRLHAREQDLPSSLQLVALPSRTGEEKTRFLLKLKDAPRAQEADQPDLAKDFSGRLAWAKPTCEADRPRRIEKIAAGD